MLEQLDEILPQKTLGGFTESKVNYMQDLLEASASSCKAEKMRLVESGKQYSARSQLHALIVSPFGSGKTTNIIDLGNSVQMTKFTEPALTGSVNEAGQLLEGLASKAAGKVLVIDEYQNLKNSARNAMLSFLEHQNYGRALGNKLNSPFKCKKKYYHIVAKDGMFNIWARFSCVCTGLSTEFRSANSKAWLSRFVLVKRRQTLQSVYDLIQGKRQLELKIDDITTLEVFEDYDKFVEKHKEIVLSLPFLERFDENDLGFIGRNCVDMARLYLVQKARGKVNDWYSILNYVPISLRNIIGASLSATEEKVLDMSMGGATQNEIAEACGVEQCTVSKVQKKLQNIGLIIKQC